nr:YdcF family protein [Secundilactobacillus folii]
MWLTTACTLTLFDALIALPIIFWPTKIIAQLISTGFATWFFVGTSYLVATFWLVHDPKTPPRADYVIVLGAKVTSAGPSRTLRRRLNTALAYANQQPFGPLFILSGGRGNDEPQTEAAAMAKYLHAHRVPFDQMLLEENSTSTTTNFKYSKLLIKANWRGPKPPIILVVTSNYHLARSILLARQHHLSVIGLGSQTTISSLFPAMIREIAALLLQFKWTLILIWFLAAIFCHLILN